MSFQGGLVSAAGFLRLLLSSACSFARSFRRRCVWQLSLGSSAILVVLKGEGENATVEERKSGSSIHLPFDELEAMHLAFDLAAAPGQ